MIRSYLGAEEKFGYQWLRCLLEAVQHQGERTGAIAEVEKLLK